MIFQNHYNREESVAKAEQMFAHLDEDGNGDLTEVGAMYYIGISVRPSVTMLEIRRCTLHRILLYVAARVKYLL